MKIQDPARVGKRTQQEDDTQKERNFELRVAPEEAASPTTDRSVGRVLTDAVDKVSLRADLGTKKGRITNTFGSPAAEGREAPKEEDVCDDLLQARPLALVIGATDQRRARFCERNTVVVN